jgi:hypothetical protein
MLEGQKNARGQWVGHHWSKLSFWAKRLLGLLKKVKF